MNYILIVIYCNMLSLFSVVSTKPKLCINCKHFKNNFWSDNSFGKCLLFPEVIKNDNYFKKTRFFSYFH